MNKNSAVFFSSFQTVLRYILLALADYDNSRNTSSLQCTFNKPITNHQETNSDLNSENETIANPNLPAPGK